MYMRELLEFIFDQIGKDRIFCTVPTAVSTKGLKADFKEMYDVEEKDIDTAMIDNFRMLSYQNGLRRYYAFSTLSGNTVNLLTDEIILDMKVIYDNGVSLLIPDPIYLQEKGFTKDSFIKYVSKLNTWKSREKIKKRLEILGSFKQVIGYYVYVNKNDEADIIDLSNKVYTLYGGTEHEKSYSFVKSIIKSDKEDKFLCSTFEKDDETDHFWYIDDETNFLGSVNQQVADTLGHWDFIVMPCTYDLFLIQTNGKTLVYSYSNNLIYNEFDLEFSIINVLNSNVKDYHNRTLLLMLNHDADREGHEDILAFTPLTYHKEEEKGKYIELPAQHVKSVKQIRGLDVLYMITDNPEYVDEKDTPIEEEDESLNTIRTEYNKNNLPYIVTLMYMNENDEFTLKELPCSSIPSQIHVSKKFGVVTMTFKQDMFYNVATFFHEYGSLYKYSYMEIATRGVREKIQRQITAKKMAQLKKHLIDTSVTERTLEEEFNQMHNFVKVKVLESKNYADTVSEPIISSSYFVDMTDNKANFDVDRLFVNNVGRFMDFRMIDQSTYTRVRKEVSKEELDSMVKRQQEDLEWVKEMMSKDSRLGGK